MLSPRLRAATLGLAVVACALALLPGPAQSAPHGTDSRADQYTGKDGQLHDLAPWTVAGKNGTLYFGEDFDSYCLYGADLQKAMKKLATVAKIIQRSGRKVVFTVGPNKSSVNKKDLDPANYPNGQCDVDGMLAQEKVMDTFKNPSYIPMRKTLLGLAKSGEQPYWRLDTHWDTVGNTRWTEALAKRLDPALAARQTYKKGKRTVNPDIAYLKGDTTTTETAPARLVTTPVRVKPVKGTQPYDVTLATAQDHAWTTSPASSTWPGRTLLVGDSFTYVTLESLRPLFAHGRFLWAGIIPDKTIIKAIKKSDTVVLQFVQRWANISPLITASFKKSLTQALG